MQCPLCENNNISSLGLIRTHKDVLELMQCQNCGEKFCVNDYNEEVKI